MHKKILQEIRLNMESKETDELLNIWQENDKEQYSEMAFEAIKQILIERGETPPPQKESLQISKQKQELTGEIRDRHRWKKLQSIGIILGLVFFFQLLVDPFDIIRSRVGALFSLGGLVLGLSCYGSAYVSRLRSALRGPSKEENTNISKPRESALSHFLGGVGSLVFAFVLLLVIRHQMQTGTRGGLITFELLFVIGGIFTTLIEWTRAIIRLVKHSREKKTHS